MHTLTIRLLTIIIFACHTPTGLPATD